MKNNLVLSALAGASLLAFVLLEGCKNTPTAETSAPPADSTAALSAADAAKFAGLWVNSAYLKVLRETQSPLKAAENAGIGSVSISPLADSSGGWMADLSYGWHEGNRLAIQSEGKNYKLVNVLDNNEKQHSLSLNADGSLQLDTLAFTPLGGHGILNPAALDHFILGGSYALKGKKDPVVFKENGAVEGLPPYTHYMVNLDYVIEESPFDALFLKKSLDDRGDYLGYEFRGNDLKMYTTECKNPKEDPCFQLKLSKLKYEMTRQGN